VHLRVDTRDDLLPGPVRTLTMTRLGSELAKPDSVKCLFVYAANPAGSTSDANAVRAGLAREDLFTVVVEQFPTDTADYADIVLPATMQTEHFDLHAGYGHLYLLWNEPATPPPGECVSTTELFRRLAAHMGMTEPSLFASDLELAEELLSSGHPSLHGVTLDRLRKEGWVRMNYPAPFAPFAEGFPTDSGRMRFPPRGKAYVPSRSSQTEGGLVLITPAPHTFLNTTFRSEEHTSELQSREKIVCPLLGRHRRVTSFPTRRSSDLQGGLGADELSGALRAVRRGLPDRLRPDAVPAARQGVRAVAVLADRGRAGADHPGAAHLPQHHVREQPGAAAPGQGPGRAGQPGRRGGARAGGRAAGPGAQRLRRVPGRRGDQRPGGAGRGRLREGPLAQAHPRRLEPERGGRGARRRPRQGRRLPRQPGGAHPSVSL